MADLPEGKGWLQLAWDNALPLLVGVGIGLALGRLAGWLFGL
jgi:hypothetical protein